MGDFSRSILSISKIYRPHTGITEIKEGVIVNLPKLKELDLSSNYNLTILHQKAFSGLPSLEILNLSGSKISEIKPETFQNLPELEILDLSYTGITEIMEGVIVNLPKLKIINKKI